MPLNSLTARIREMLRGDKVSEEAVFAELYGSLRSAARHLLRREAASGWTPTELVNETYARQLSRGKYAITDRHHFIRVAQRAMRHVLIDAARSRQTAKRGGGAALASLDESGHDAPVLADSIDPEEILSLHNALDALARMDQRAADVFELRHFFGYSTEEVAEILEVSPERVRDDWEFSRTWLRDRIQTDIPGDRP